VSYESCKIKLKVYALADPERAAAEVSSSFFRAFVEHFTAKPMHPGWSKFAKQLTATVAPQP